MSIQNVESIYIFRIVVTCLHITCGCLKLHQFSVFTHLFSNYCISTSIYQLVFCCLNAEHKGERTSAPSILAGSLWHSCSHKVGHVTTHTEGWGRASWGPESHSVSLPLLRADNGILGSIFMKRPIVRDDNVPILDIIWNKYIIIYQKLEFLLSLDLNPHWT